ncbi:MAG TPA: hypothetical protein P5079_01195 [Elusimicrobiota bacterium]|nr:hypothetical protein [Elusimicrobiota bacterium]
MDTLPVKHQKVSEVLEPEIVGLEPAVPFWKRAVRRVTAGLALGFVGLGMTVLGGLFTLTIVGAGIGLPLVFLGILVMVFAVFLFFADRSTVSIRFRR